MRRCATRSALVAPFAGRLAATNSGALPERTAPTAGRLGNMAPTARRLGGGRAGTAHAQPSLDQFVPSTDVSKAPWL